MHVYSNNKAGHGVSHRPIVNPNGKCELQILSIELLYINYNRYYILIRKIYRTSLFSWMLASNIGR